MPISTAELSSSIAESLLRCAYLFLQYALCIFYFYGRQQILELSKSLWLGFCFLPRKSHYCIFHARPAIVRFLLSSLLVCCSFKRLVIWFIKFLYAGCLFACEQFMVHEIHADIVLPAHAVTKMEPGLVSSFDISPCRVLMFQSVL